MTIGQEKQVKMSELMAALGMTTELAHGQVLEQGLRRCFMGMHLAEALKLSEQERSDIFYTTLLQHVS